MYGDSDQESWQSQVSTTMTPNVMLIDKEAVAGTVKNAEYDTGEGDEDKNGHDVDDKNKHITKAKSPVSEAFDSQGFIERNTMQEPPLILKTKKTMLEVAGSGTKLVVSPFLLQVDLTKRYPGRLRQKHSFLGSHNERSSKGGRFLGYSLEVVIAAIHGMVEPSA
jgi:hypothetical protein